MIVRLFFLFISFALYAQAPPIDWQKTYGGSNSDDVSSILGMADGFLVAGSSNSPVSGDKTVFNGLTDAWLIKFDNAGNEFWQNSCANNTLTAMYLPQIISVSGFPNESILIGSTKPEIDTYYMSLILTDSEGTIAQNGSTGVSSDCPTDSNGFGTSLVNLFFTGDDSFISSGTFSSPFSLCVNGESYYIEKRSSIDASGPPAFAKYIGGDSADILTSCIETTEGNILLLGYSDSSISGDKSEQSRGFADYWLVKLAPNGNIIWQKTIGGSDIEQSTNVIETTDGGYIVGGSSNSNISGDKVDDSKGGYDYWIVKLSPSGTIDWQKTIGGALDDKLAKIRITNDGGYILCGTSNSPASGDKSENARGASDVWLVKIDGDGNVQWDKTIGGSGIDSGADVLQAEDNGFIVAATSASSASGDKTENSRGGNDYWIIKLLPEDLSTDENPFESFVIYPNPFHNEITIKSPNGEHFQLTVFDTLGRLIFDEKLTGLQTIAVDGAAGVYFVEIHDESGQKKTFTLVKHLP